MNKFLIIGLGSMGKRRVRCLQALGYKDIVAFDLREDRRKEAESIYGIKTISEIEDNIINRDAVIVSTPPDCHASYAKMAIENNKPLFVEASVILEDVLDIQQANKNNTFVAPSCTMRFHPMIKDIKLILNSNKYGKITNFSYHSGQYLPDWHPWEDMQDYYVSNKPTGAAREIVPFELTWLVDILGFPKKAIGLYGKTFANMGVDIDDSYACALQFENHINGTLLVDVVSRFATRSLIINLEKAQIRWNWEDNCIKVYEADSGRWVIYNQPEFIAHGNYNKNIGEQMYIDEVRAFLNGIADRNAYPSSLEDDIKVLEILKEVER